MHHRNDPEGLAGRKLYLGGLLEDVRKEELTKELARFGPLDDVWIARNPPGFAFVLYQREADAERCVRALDGMNVCGSRIRAEFAHRLSKQTPAKFGRSREAMERGPRTRPENDRPYHQRSEERSRNDRLSRPFVSDRLDRRTLRTADAARRDADLEAFRPKRSRCSPETEEEDVEPSRNASRPRRSYTASDDLDSSVRRQPPSYEYRQRRKSPNSPAEETRRNTSSGRSYRRGATGDNERYPRSEMCRDRDRSPTSYRATTGRATDADEYAGYYGNQTPPLEFGDSPHYNAP